MLARPKELGLTPADPFKGGVVVHPYPAALDTDMHQAFELGVLLGGKEERHFEDTVIPLGPGDVWLCAAWEPHGWRASAPGTYELVTQFLPEFVGEEMLDDVSWLSLFAAPPDQRPKVTYPETRERIMSIAQDIRREMQQRRSGWLAAIRLYILQVLLAISREWHPDNGTARQRTVRAGSLGKVMPAVRLIYSNPARRLTVEEAAAACGLSVSQFGHAFRHVMGQSYCSFRTRTRLAYAAQLLLTTDWPVERIAEQLGFADASHLHHAFAKIYGCTPARYRTEGQDRRGFRRYTLVESSTPDDPELQLAVGGQQLAPWTPCVPASPENEAARAAE
jgi:AraC-like DNA-binding protein